MIANSFKTWCRLKGPHAVKDGLAMSAIFLVILATLPLLAFVIFAVRTLLLVLLILGAVAAIIAYAASPRFRRWLREPR